MSESDRLQAKLAPIESSREWMRVIGVVLMVLGIVYTVLGCLQLLPILASPGGAVEVVQWALRTLIVAAAFFVVAWFVLRVADALGAVASLIREMAEVV